MFCRLHLATCRAPRSCLDQSPGRQATSVQFKRVTPGRETCARGTTPIFCAVDGRNCLRIVITCACLAAATPTHGARGQCSKQREGC